MIKKIIITLILMLGIFLFIRFDSKAATSTSLAGVVSTGGANLNIRAEATTSSNIKGKLADGSYFTIISSKGNWHYIEYQDNQYGYVHKDYVSIKSSEVAYVNTGFANLNVRTGPSTSYTIISKLKDKEYVVILSKTNGWAKILYDGNKIGYVSQNYLSKNYTYPEINLNVISYKQYDSRWADKQIGTSGKTFRQIGCLTTSMAMAESYRRGETLTPLYYESVSSYTSDGSLYWPSRYSFITSYNLSSIYNILKQGKPVLLGCRNSNGGQHWVLIYGYSGGNTLQASNFLIRDPGSSTRTKLSEFLNTYPSFYKISYYK